MTRDRAPAFRTFLHRLPCNFAKVTSFEDPSGPTAVAVQVPLWSVWPRRAEAVTGSTCGRHATRSCSRRSQPEKTFIGRIEKGFDFLGFRLSPHGITMATATWERFVERALRLYEQDRREPDGSPRLDAYVLRWRGWARPVLRGQATS